MLNEFQNLPHPVYYQQLRSTPQILKMLLFMVQLYLMSSMLQPDQNLALLMFLSLKEILLLTL